LADRDFDGTRDGVLNLAVGGEMFGPPVNPVDSLS